jgi:hypothetical protein
MSWVIGEKSCFSSPSTVDSWTPGSGPGLDCKSLVVLRSHSLRVNFWDPGFIFYSRRTEHLGQVRKNIFLEPGSGPGLDCKSLVVLRSHSLRVNFWDPGFIFYSRRTEHLGQGRKIFFWGPDRVRDSAKIATFLWSNFIRVQEKISSSYQLYA